MSWGKRIAILYVGFVLMIAALIFRSSMENTDLVSDDYYNRELHFQEQIDGTESLLNSGLKPVVSCTENTVVVQLPDSLSRMPEGKVVFYRPDNAQLDREFPLTSSRAELGKENFSGGTYQVRLQWKDNGEEYFFETSLYVQ